MTPDGWRSVALANAATARVEGCTPMPDDERPYIALEHMAQGEPRLLGWSVASKATSTKAVFRKGDLLFGKLRPNLHKALVAPFEGICSTDILVIRPQRETEIGFLLHLAHSAAFRDHAVKTASGTKMPRTSWPLLGPFMFGLPPAGEQRKIAAILSSVDDAIEATQAVIDQLQAVNKAMMAELLTRGLPGRHTRFKQTEIGEVPEEWEIVTVAEVGPTDRPTAQTGPFGAQLRPEDFSDTGTPVLRIGNVQWGYLKLDDLDFVRPEKAVELRRYRVREGDLLFARQGATTGRNALADSRCAGWLINYHIIRVATDHARCLPEFLMTCFNSELVQKQVGREKGRGNRDGINTANILAFRLPLPSLDEQKGITQALAGLDQAVAANQDVTEQLRRAKAALLSVLLTGEVRVTPDEAAA